MGHVKWTLSLTITQTHLSLKEAAPPQWQEKSNQMWIFQSSGADLSTHKPTLVFMTWITCLGSENQSLFHHLHGLFWQILHPTLSVWSVMLARIHSHMCMCVCVCVCVCVCMCITVCIVCCDKWGIHEIFMDQISRYSKCKVYAKKNIPINNHTK